MTVDRFQPVPQLSISVGGARDARRHFRAEYGPALVSRTGSPTGAEVDIIFGDELGERCADGGHKTVRWTVALGEPDTEPLTARIRLRGRPRRFAFSLVQGFVVEPLVSVAAARAGLVLLPAGALMASSGAVILLGRSGSGKTSVVARALAAGRPALGDDQIMLTRRGEVRPWPRRLRVYPDLRVTAPTAVRLLGRRRRAALRALATLRATTRGWVAPSMPLRWQELGAEPVTGPVPARRVVVIERTGAAEAVEAEPLSGDAVAALSGEILREQRARFAALAGPRWSTALADVERAEQALLTPVLAGLPAERWRVPVSWSASTAVDALAARLGVGG